jgi:protein O-GlcNAc transferase
VQVTWLGYPNTTGLTEIDFRLTDATSDPVGQTEGWHSESLWRLPDGFLTYGPPPEAPRVIDPPHLQRGYLTFGCFNHAAKINQQCIRLWAAVLQKVPGSRLLLKARGLHEATTIERLASEFAGLGITPERLTFRGERLSVVDQLALVQSVDLALDTFPYNGTTTTCESLWMGVPVVALAGRTHVARVGASLLRQVGLEACVAPEESEYVERACRFAKDSAWLTEMRRSLRTRFRASSLGDAVKFTSQLEEAFVRMCRNRS